MTPYYEQDGITIYHGDCREVLPLLAQRPAVLVTDPPYGRSYATNREVRGVAATWRGEHIVGDADTALRDWLVEWAAELPMLIFGSWRAVRPAATRAVLIWDKGPASGMGDLSIPWKGSFEEVYVLGTGFHGNRDEGVIKGFSIVTWESQGRCHPTQKPDALLRYLISKTPDGVICDPCMGSGSTLRAAMDLHRQAIGIEIEERYCEVAANRLRQMVLL